MIKKHWNFSDFESEKDYTCENQVEKVSMRSLCDGTPDCSDGSDELYCDQFGAKKTKLGQVEYFYEDGKPTAKEEEFSWKFKLVFKYSKEF